MSHDDQRNHPNEEPARDLGAAAGSAEPARTAAPDDVAAETTTRTGATAATGATTTTGPTAATGTTAATTTTGGTAAAGTFSGATRREFQEPGDGAPRYAATAEQVPRSGSEESWSAAPHPGYQRDPAIYYPNRRLLAGALIGSLLMAAFVVYGVRILANRSNNGNGSAAWTAAVERDGAVVGGINAQGNGSPPEVPQQVAMSSGNANGGGLSAAIASCHTATGVTVPVTTATGTKAGMTDWAAHSASSVQSLRNDAAALRNAINLGHAGAVASAANTLCADYPGVVALPPMPDAEGSQAWSSAVTSFATAATQSLQGANGNPDATGAAIDALAKGDKELDALSARIAAAT